MQPLILACVYAALAGIASHLIYFIRGNHLHEAPILVRVFFLAPVLLFSAIKTLATSFSIVDAAVWSVAIFASFVSSLWTSIVTYRLCFHPLRHFPGPVVLRLSSVFQLLSTMGKRNLHQQVERWHDKFGDFVRTGPDEIAVFAGSEAFHALLGTGTKCTKGDWYAKVPVSSIVMTANKADHAKRRRIWDQGFGKKALQTYESLISSLVLKLVDRIGEHNGKSLDVTHLFHCFAFDFMGDFVFGNSFGMMEKGGQTHFVVKAIQVNQRENGNTARIPWLWLTLITAPRWLMKGSRAVQDWARTQIQKRLALEKETDRADVMSAIIQEYHKAENKKDAMNWLIGDARAAIVAGSDTTASTLCFLFYYLTKHPENVATIRDELEPLTNDQGCYTNLDLQNSAPHLNGVINETLRLHPAVPSGLLRVTPDEGITIAGTYIPGNTTVYAPIAENQKLASCFDDPKSFVPERWTTRPEMIKDRAAYAPFSIGPYGCVGKQVALMELRIVTATLLSKFDLRFGPGEDGRGILHESEDCFVIQPKPLYVAFLPRSGTQEAEA